MDWDELEPGKKPEIAIGDDLSSLSLEELNRRINALTNEIARIKAEITAKKSTQSAAEDIFKG